MIPKHHLKLSPGAISTAATAALSVIATGVAVNALAVALDRSDTIEKYAVEGDEYWVAFCLC